MIKNLLMLLALLLFVSCQKEIPNNTVTAKTQEVKTIETVNRNDFKNYSYLVNKAKVNGYLTTNTYHGELIQYGGYIEGKKYGEHKHYYGEDNLLYKIHYNENSIEDQTINVFDLKGNPLYDVTYKNGKPINYNEKQKIQLPKQLKDKIILNENRWFVVSAVTVTGDFNSDGTKDFVLKYRDDYKYKFVAFISNVRTKTWVTIFQNDYRSKDVLNRFNYGDNPQRIIIKNIEGIDCLDEGNGTIIYFDEVANAFKYYKYD